MLFWVKVYKIICIQTDAFSDKVVSQYIERSLDHLVSQDNVSSIYIISLLIWSPTQVLELDTVSTVSITDKQTHESPITLSEVTNRIILVILSKL